MNKIVPLGDKAVLAEFAETLDLAVNERIQRLAKAIEQRRMQWVTDVIPGLASLAIHFDRRKVGPGSAPLSLAAELIEDCLAEELPDLDALTRAVELPVCYEKEFAPDLEEVAERCKLTPGEVVAKHAGSSHRVLMVGFVPGHPYIGGLDPALSVPRRPTPRTCVATGSIAIANAQTVVYPFPTPSGWSIIGRSPERIFDVARQRPAMMAPGDRVRFVPISGVEFERRLRSPAG
jgi:inhibitor of KinA